MDYLPYSRTNIGITILYHLYRCRHSKFRDFVYDNATCSKGGLLDRIYSHNQNENLPKNGVYIEQKLSERVYTKFDIGLCLVHMLVL